MSTKKAFDLSNMSVPVLLAMNDEPDRSVIKEYVGNKNLFMFTLGYCEPPESFCEIIRYKRELDIAAGRKRSFSGTVVIDLSKWTGSEDSVYFDAFLAYLYDNDHGISYIFAVNSLDCNAIYKKLSEYFAVDMIQLNVCKGQLLHEHIKDYFLNKKVNISGPALKFLCSVLEEYAEERAFNIRRLETICDRLISVSKDKIVDEAQVRKFSASENIDKCSKYEMSCSFGITALEERAE